MTMQRYANTGCAAESQVCGDTSSAVAGNPDNVWIVNFNNGNSDYNHRDNTAWVRAVRSVSPPSECHGVAFRDLYNAWKQARRNKKPSLNQMVFDSAWSARLVELQRQLSNGTWKPLPTTCFIAARPKAREIHAPDFSDRVVHHWLVPQLEAVYEPRFISDSFANRRGKGTHAAVNRLRDFVRQVEDGQGGGWYLQLDIHNFFNSIHRPTLWEMLKRRMVKHGVTSVAQRAAHALLRRAPSESGVVYRATAAERALVPPHKQLANAPAGCGLPIGNLSSQFLANVYLDALDQFCKHTLRAPRYLRYVDDFVLVHHDREQLQRWQEEIQTFLKTKLRLRLKADIRLRPLRSGIDFLGYLIYPRHTRVRRRVVSHARGALQSWYQIHRSVDGVRVTPRDLADIASVWASYCGHMRHANTTRLRTDFHRKYPWLRAVAERRRRFHPTLRDRMFSIRIPECRS